MCSCGLRIAWSYHQDSVNLAIAAQIFVEAGTVILYIVNLFLAQRMMRARHPHIGWWKPFTIIMGPVIIGITFISLAFIIVAGILSYFTLNANTQRITYDILCFGETEFAVASFIPIVVILLMLVIPRRTYIDKFGAGRYKTKVIIALVGSILVSLGSAFRAATTWLPEVSVESTPKWYFSKTCFYIFDYGLDIMVLYLYLITRVDRRFYVPDGAQGAGAYSGDVVEEPPSQAWDYEIYMRTRRFEGDETTLDQDGESIVEPSYLEMDPKSGKWNMLDPSRSHITLASTLHSTYCRVSALYALIS